MRRVVKCSSLAAISATGSSNQAGKQLMYPAWDLFHSYPVTCAPSPKSSSVSFPPVFPLQHLQGLPPPPWTPQKTPLSPSLRAVTPVIWPGLLPSCPLSLAVPSQPQPATGPADGENATDGEGPWPTSPRSCRRKACAGGWVLWGACCRLGRVFYRKGCIDEGG